MDFLHSTFKEIQKPEVRRSELSECKEMPLPGADNKFHGEVQQKESLSLFEKTVVKFEQTSWSFNTIEHIDTMEEYEVYKEAGLEQKQVGDKVGLVRDDIDFSQKDEFGRTNEERIDANLSPLNKNGETIELHHVGQKADSPFAELTRDEHRGAGNDTVLHDKTIKSEIDRGEFQQEKIEYWKTRKEMEA
ncbi:MAG: HNH/ENDO VII family nuclease [Sporomusaceae bacterium]|nr:HNH/ENDO VII family nuclease [Sporomusaceae bacterium]